MKIATTGVSLAIIAALAACAASTIQAQAEPVPLTSVKPAPSKAEVEAQILAIEASGNILAPPALTERIANELGDIRLAFPNIEGIRARPRWEPTSLLVAFDPPVREQVVARNYGHWDAANRNYEVREIDTRMLQSGDSGIAILRFSRAINAPKVASEYAMLPGVSYAEPDGLAGDGPDICLAQRGTTHFYVFDQASGDCPAGCLEHKYWVFKVEPNQTPVATPDAKKADFPECTKWL